MTDIAQQQRYTSVAIALHWTIALLIIGMIAFGWILEDMAGGPGSPKVSLIQVHKSVGITILLLSVARIVWRLMNPPPPEPPMPQWQKLLATSVHILLYVLMIAMPLTGWIMASASTAHDTRFFGTLEVTLPGFAGMDAAARKPIEEGFHSVHGNLAWVIIAMLALHVAGAVKHQFIDKDGLLARMAPGLFGRTAGPPASGKGLIWAIGAAVVVFAAVASASLLSASAPAATAPTGEPQLVENSPAGNWAVDAAQSSIKFKAAYMGRPFEGRFGKWDASIQFDPAKPQDARIKVTIPMASVDASDPYFNENITQGDWFDVQKHPEAVFAVNEGVTKKSETEYEAAGVLTIKGQAYPLRLPFTLNITGPTAKMHGEVTLKRLDLGIGRSTEAEAKGDAEWVQNDVAVVIDVVATQQ